MGDQRLAEHLDRDPVVDGDLHLFGADVDAVRNIQNKRIGDVFTVNFAPLMLLGVHAHTVIGRPVAPIPVKVQVLGGNVIGCTAS